MNAELTSEEIVTQLLTSEEVLKRTANNDYITSPSDLQDYLYSNASEEEYIIEAEFQIEPPPTRYTFIKQTNSKIFC